MNVLQASSDGEGLDDVPPPAVEQRAIVEALEEDEEEDETIHTYCVPKIWYRTWCKYVGLTSELLPLRHPRQETKSKSGKSTGRTNSERKAERDAPLIDLKGKHRSERKVDRKNSESTSSLSANDTEDTTEFHSQVRMDLTNDENNMFVKESVWRCWITWYGIDETHELDRRNYASEDKDFEICILSPYCGLIENVVKTFDISEEIGYIEVQLRRIFRIAQSRSTRLWMCEKTRHARFQPLLNRKQELYFQNRLNLSKSYILAIEMANLDESWPTHVPDKPTDSLAMYKELTEGGRMNNSQFWNNELKETLNAVFSGISNELNETANGIINTTKCIVSLKEQDLDKVNEQLHCKVDQLNDKQLVLDKKISDLRLEEETVRQEKEKLSVDKDSFSEERQRFAEELVRMHTINRIAETRVKLNVGGHVFMTSTLTLTKEADSMLAAMFSGRHSLKQEGDGSYFLDRDGTHFRYILNYLRDGTFRPGTLPTSDGFLAELYNEAEYYQLGGLVQLLDSVMKNKSVDSGLISDESPDGSLTSAVSPQLDVNNSKILNIKRVPRKVISHAKS